MKRRKLKLKAKLKALCHMTFQDKPTSEKVIFGHSNSRRPELIYVFERGLVFKCHILVSNAEFQAIQCGYDRGNLHRPT